MVSIIDRDEQIEKLLPYLDEMVQEGLIASSRVDVIRLSRSSANDGSAKSE